MQGKVLTDYIVGFAFLAAVALCGLLSFIMLCKLICCVLVLSGAVYCAITVTEQRQKQEDTWKQTLEKMNSSIAALGLIFNFIASPMISLCVGLFFLLFYISYGVVNFFTALYSPSEHNYSIFYYFQVLSNWCYNGFMLFLYSIYKCGEQLGILWGEMVGLCNHITGGQEQCEERRVFQYQSYLPYATIN